MGGALGNNSCKGVREAAWDRGKSSNRGLGQAHRELWSLEVLSEMSPVEARGVDFVPPHQPVRTLGKAACFS